MSPEINHTAGDIKLGRFSYTHNRFLLCLLCLAIAAFVLADMVGGTLQPGMTLTALMTSRPIIWAVLLLPISIFGCLAFDRSGHRDTAISCAVVSGFFALGTTLSALWA